MGFRRLAKGPHRPFGGTSFAPIKAAPAHRCHHCSSLSRGRVPPAPLVPRWRWWWRGRGRAGNCAKRATRCRSDRRAGPPADRTADRGPGPCADQAAADCALAGVIRVGACRQTKRQHHRDPDRCRRCLPHVLNLSARSRSSEHNAIGSGSWSLSAVTLGWAPDAMRVVWRIVLRLVVPKIPAKPGLWLLSPAACAVRAPASAASGEPEARPNRAGWSVYMLGCRRTRRGPLFDRRGSPQHTRFVLRRWHD